MSRVRKYGLGVQPDLSQDRLVLPSGMERIAPVLQHGQDYPAPCRRNRLMPGLKITLPSTTTSSSSRNSCTDLLSTWLSRSSPLRLTSSTRINAHVDMENVLQNHRPLVKLLGHEMPRAPVHAPRFRKPACKDWRPENTATETDEY